jgi:hypothetical protein
VQLPLSASVATGSTDAMRSRALRVVAKRRMRVALEQFRWECFLGGYEWQSVGASVPFVEAADTRSERVLTKCATPEMTRVYCPLIEYATLFREFAALTPSEASFVAFANAFGHLGVAPGATAAVGSRIVAEPLSRWVAEWTTLRNVVHVLDAVQAHDHARLVDCLIIGDTSAALDLRIDGALQKATPIADASHLRPWLWRHATRADTSTERLARLARGWLQTAITTAIGSPGMVSAQVLFNDAAEQHELQVVPESLMGAIWLQCARVLTLNLSFRPCRHCGKALEVSPEARRPNARYCHDGCKVAAFRERKLRRSASAGR